MSDKTIYLTRKDEGVGVGVYDSIHWAFEVHVGQPDMGEYHYAMLYGNEDSPVRIEFWRESPNWDTPPDMVWEAPDVR